jgi:hypothetical protein
VPSSLSKHVKYPPISLSVSTRNFVGSWWNFYQGTLHQKTNDVSNSVARFRTNIKRRPSVREEKARQPLCMGSTYASQITCVDDVIHAVVVRVVGGQADTPTFHPDGWRPSNATRKGEEPDEPETDGAHCDLLSEASSSMYVYGMSFCSLEATNSCKMQEHLAGRALEKGKSVLWQWMRQLLPKSEVEIAG